VGTAGSCSSPSKRCTPRDCVSVLRGVFAFRLYLRKKIDNLRILREQEVRNCSAYTVSVSISDTKGESTEPTPKRKSEVESALSMGL
jgi:hypothetical protein